MLAAIGEKSVAELATLTFMVTASDVNEPADTLTYTATGLPADASFDPATRQFSWTPTEAQGPGSYDVTFAVSDGIVSDSETVTITVSEVNVPPRMGRIRDKSVAELESLTFTLSARDIDQPANTLTYSAMGLPAGASFDPATRQFSWTPTEAQGPGSYDVTFAVSDGIVSDSETVTITVSEVNVPPRMGRIRNKSVAELESLTFTLSARDIDKPANTLTYSAMGLPVGASFDPATRQFSWTPTEAQGPGSYDVTFAVSDGASSDSRVVTIPVSEVNVAPVLATIGEKSVAEMATLTFTVAASDIDEPANTLTYSATGLPAGASFDPATQQFRWTPSEAQGPGSYDVTFAVSDGIVSDSETVTITVSEVNVPPLMGRIRDKSVAELESLTFTLSARDIDEPANTLTYSAMGLPAGAALIRRHGNSVGRRLKPRVRAATTSRSRSATGPPATQES